MMGSRSIKCILLVPGEFCPVVMIFLELLRQQHASLAFLCILHDYLMAVTAEGVSWTAHHSVSTHVVHMITHVVGCCSLGQC